MNEIFTKIGGYIASGDTMVNHDNTLSGNGTVDSPLGLNETVLWSNSDGATSCTLSENYTNFEYIDVYYMDSDVKVMMKRIVTAQTFNSFNVSSEEVSDNMWIKTSSFSINGTAIVRTGNCQIKITPGASVSYSTASDFIKLYKIVGINRIANN